MTKSKLSWSAYLLALFLPFTYSAFAQDQADKPEGDAPADGDAPAADGGGDAPAADAPAAGGDTAGGGDAPAADTPAPAAGGDAAAAPAAPAADAAPATPATDAAAAPSPAPAAAPAAPAGDAPAAPSPAAPAPAPAAPATAAPAPAAPAPVAPAPAPVVAAPAPPPAAPAPPPPAPIAPPPPPPPPPAALTLESNPITQAVVATGGAISISDVVSIGSSNIKKMAANPNDGAGGNVLNDLNRNLKARVSVVKAFEGVADVETLVNEAVKIKKDELESLNELSRDEAKALRNNATDATKIGQVATKAKVVKTFKDSGVAVSSFDKINDLDDDNLDALKKIDTSTLGVLAKSGAGSGASALALNDIDKFATKAELAVTFFEDTSAPADPNDIAIIEFDATKLEQLDTQINALDTSALDNFKKMDKDVLDVLAKSGSGNSAARLDISSIDKVAAKAKMAVAVLGSAGNAPIDFDAAKIAQVDTYINAIEDDFLDAIDEIDITNLTNDKDGNAFDITKVDKIASKAAVVKTFTDLGQFDPNADSADFTQFNNLEEDSLDAFLAFEPEQLQNLAKDGSGSADLSRLDDIATQAKFTKVLIDSGKSFTEAEVFVDDPNKFNPDDFANLRLDDISTSFQANAGSGTIDLDILDLDQIKSTAEVINDLTSSGDSAPSAADLLAQLGNAVLKDVNNIPLVLNDPNDENLLKWADNLRGAKFYALWDDGQNDGGGQHSGQSPSHSSEEFGLVEIEFKPENAEVANSPLQLNGKDLLGHDAGSSWVESYEKETDSVIKLTETNGNKISVTYVKVMKDPTDNGAPTLALLEFASSDDYYSDLFYSDIDTTQSQAIISTFIAANSPETMPEESFNIKMFASLTDATTRYNQVFDGYAEPALSDNNDNYMAALFDMHGVNKALWARDLSGASIDIIGFSQRTVSSSDGAYFGSTSSTVIDAQPIREQLTFTATHAQWIENGVTVSAPYKNLGSVIEITENNNGNVYTSYYKIGVTQVFDSQTNSQVNQFRIVSLEFGPGRPSGSVVDTTLVQNLIESDNLFYSNSFPAGLIGAGDYTPSSVGVYSRVFATESEADVFYNQLNSDYQSYANLLANDLDGDGVVNSQDQQPNDPYRASGVDSDNDGVDDEFDINDNDPNIMLGDIDGDGIDDKNDISLNDGPLADFDNDGVINRDDPDDDNDGILDQDDSEDFIANTPANDYAYGDSDNDGIANRFDDDFDYSVNNGKLDDDSDGVPNFADADNSYNIFGTDNNNNGILDFAEYSAPTQTSVTSLLTNFGINATTNVDTILEGLHSYEPNANLGLQKTIDLINLLFKQQTISGGDIDDHPDLIDMVTADIAYAHATSDQFLGLIKEFNLIADSSNEAMVDTLLSALFQQTNGESWIDITFGMNHDPANNNHQQPNNNHSDPIDMVANYAHLLDGLLGANRGELKVNDPNERPESLRAANLDFEVKDINFRVISGHTVNIGGSLTDSDDDASPKDVDLTIIASGRDTTLTGNSLSITSGGAQNVTDAYLIASADELYLRSEWTAASHAAHYADPDPYSIDIDNASFAMASIDDMHLINLDITTEGSLAIATLDDLNLRSTKPSDDNIFKVGHQGIRNEGLFLYAKDEMSLSDLRIEGNVDDIYMEATTINLTDVTFPQMSTVLLRSKLKGMTFDGEAYQVDKVNFRNVQHLAIDPVNRIDRSDFVGHKSTAVSSSGRPRIEVQGWGSSN